MKKRAQSAIKKQILGLCLAIAFAHTKGAVDYNGNPINRGGSFTITPRTSSAVLASYTQAVNLDGLVDKTFGIEGFSIPLVGGADNEAYACTLQPDGKIIAVGFSGDGPDSPIGNNKFALVRCNSNGSLDNSFGTGGIVVTDFGVTATSNLAYACTLQPDGKIVVAGQSNKNKDDKANFDFALVRYLTNGTPDPSFGTGGIVVSDFGVTATNNQALACVLQPDGKIIAAGSSNKDDQTFLSSNFALIRYLSNGIPDSSFGADHNGIVVTAIQGNNDDSNQANACLLQSDGKIIAIGSSTNQQDNNPQNGVTDFALVRYDTNGIPDPSFGANHNGIVVTDFGTTGTNSFAYTGALQSDGKIVVAGTTNKPNGGDNHNFALVRYDTNGIPDPSFGANHNGIVVTSIGSGTNNQAYACTIQPDGKIVVAGWANKEGATIFDFTLVRYNSDGTLDKTFGVNGIMATNLGGSDNNEAYACSLQPDGKIIVVGFSNVNNPNTTNYDFAIARYINPFTLASLTASYGGVGLL